MNKEQPVVTWRRKYKDVYIEFAYLSRRIIDNPIGCLYNSWWQFLHFLDIPQCEDAFSFFPGHPAAAAFQHHFINAKNKMQKGQTPPQKKKV